MTERDRVLAAHRRAYAIWMQDNRQMKAWETKVKLKNQKEWFARRQAVWDRANAKTTAMLRAIKDRVKEAGNVAGK